MARRALSISGESIRLFQGVAVANGLCQLSQPLAPVHLPGPSQFVAKGCSPPDGQHALLTHGRGYLSWAVNAAAPAGLLQDDEPASEDEDDKEGMAQHHGHDFDCEWLRGLPARLCNNSHTWDSHTWNSHIVSIYDASCLKLASTETAVGPLQHEAEALSGNFSCSPGKVPRRGS